MYKRQVYQLIGPIDKSEKGGFFTNQVRENPFSLILLDEIEKAHPDVLNLFLQIFDEGECQDNLGRKVDFRNTIIIGTSNAGAELIRKKVAQNVPPSKIKEELQEFILKNHIFTPEFLNRFDGVIFFKPLDQKELIKIAQMLVSELAESLKREKGIRLEVEEKVFPILAKKGYNPEMGARPLRRVIDETIGNIVAQKILRNEVKGGRIKISVQDLNLV